MSIIFDPTPDEFARDIAAAKREMRSQFGDADATAASWASERMQARYNALHPRLTGRASGSFRSSGPRLRWGRGSIPYMMGQNFGSARYRQFPRRVEPDHFAYSVVSKGAPTIQAMYDAAVVESVGEAFNGQG